MGRTEKASSWLRRRRLAGAGTVAAVALLVSPAAALGATSGAATIRPAHHDGGRTLSGQGVEILAGTGATAGANAISLPIDTLQAGGATPWAETPAALSFVHGKSSLTLSAIRFEFGAGTLTGLLGGRRLPVFRLGAAVDIDPTTGTVSFTGNLRLTAAAAKLLRSKLGLERALVDRGVGQVSMIATSPPPPPDEVPPPTPVFTPPPVVNPPAPPIVN